MSVVTDSPEKPHHAVSHSALLWPLKAKRLPIKALYCMNVDLSPGQPGRDAPLLSSIAVSHFALARTNKSGAFINHVSPCVSDGTLENQPDDPPTQFPA